MKKWIKKHPDLWQFILFNLLANCATITNFCVMWLCTGFVFRSCINTPFHFWVFDYTSSESLMLGGFLSFLAATTAAQIVNYFVQKKLVFRSSVAFAKAVPKYIVMVVVLVIISAALPGYTQKILIEAGIPENFAPTLANCGNILVQVVISYPSMKLWIMPSDENTEQHSEKD